MTKADRLKKRIRIKRCSRKLSAVRCTIPSRSTKWKKNERSTAFSKNSESGNEPPKLVDLEMIAGRTNETGLRSVCLEFRKRDEADVVGFVFLNGKGKFPKLVGQPFGDFLRPFDR